MGEYPPKVFTHVRAFGVFAMLITNFLEISNIMFYK